MSDQDPQEKIETDDIAFDLDSPAKSPDKNEKLKSVNKPDVKPEPAVKPETKPEPV